MMLGDIPPILSLSYPATTASHADGVISAIKDSRESPSGP